MARKSIQVKPKSNGWTVIRTDSRQTIGTYRTKGEATKTARRIANEQNFDLVIQARIGGYGTARGIAPRSSRGESRGIEPKIKTDLSTKAVRQSRESNAERKARLWREWANSHQRDTASLSDEAISRESIYGDRG
jgi:hypothetical protein